jgi:hypothetical protein
MKKHFTILALTLFTIRAFAQDTIPNPSFERWTSVQGTFITYEEPNGWQTPNSYTQITDSIEVIRSTDSYSGQYAAQLQSKSVSGFDVPGIILLGHLNISGTTGSIAGGVPFTAEPQTLKGFYKYTPATGQKDSAFVYALFTYWHSNTKTRDTLGGGSFISGATITNYTEFTDSIYYNPLYSSESPDTIQVGILSSALFFAAPPGSVMLVDSLFFTGIPSGINTVIDKGFSVSCYPNPAIKNLNILISEPRPGMLIKVYDALGRNILSANNEGLITSFDVSQLSNGIYFYEVLDSNGNLLKSDKFTVVR